MAELKNSIPAISFYDLHAADYNNRMSASDSKVRGAVRDCFIKYTNKGKVLDFGGGTGLDLPWLCKQYDKVFFIEPSAGMRAEARKLIFPGCAPIFVDENLDFNDWEYPKLPFTEKMDGILANFAVFNCIQNIDVLFHRLSLLSFPGAHLVINVLNTSPKKMLTTYSIKFALLSIMNMKIEVPNTGKGISHPTYLHTLRQYLSASKGYFNLVAYFPIAHSNFMVLIFSKNEQNT